KADPHDGHVLRLPYRGHLNTQALRIRHHLKMFGDCNGRVSALELRPASKICPGLRPFDRHVSDDLGGVRRMGFDEALRAGPGKPVFKVNTRRKSESQVTGRHGRAGFVVAQAHDSPVAETDLDDPANTYAAQDGSDDAGAFGAGIACRKTSR